MSPSPQLAPPGSSTYNSQTMHVGDGTWDAGRDTFLLPNLVGFNFATMRYNGMGNRFFSMNGYHGLIRAHGIMAAITFLGIVPSAIFLMRFYGRRPRWALRLHIWLQILTLLLLTVVFILGWIAVGPRRSLTNPHHGIGLAIYVLVWFQVIGGCLAHRREKKKRSLHIPITAMLHHWLGRAIALLGIAQVALGLTLYGSPVYLFVLYALLVFALVVLYFILEWLAERRRARYGSEGSVITEEVVEGRDERKGGGIGKWLGAGAAGLGLATLLKRRSSHNRPRTNAAGTESSLTSMSYTDYSEKQSDSPRKGLGTRLLQFGAIAGGVAAAKRLFGRKDHRDDVSDAGPYRPPLGGNQSVTTDSMSRVEEGRPGPRPTTPVGNSPGYARPSHPLAQPPLTPGSGRRNSNSSFSYYSYYSGSPSRRSRKNHNFRDALATGGAVFAVRQLFKNRRQRKEERRAEDLRTQRLDEEKVARMNSTNRYTGDGIAPPGRLRHNRAGSQSASDTSSVMEETTVRPGAGSMLPATGAGAAAATALADRDRIRPPGRDPVINAPGTASAFPTDIPPIPPPHRSEVGSSGSDLYTTTSGRQRHRHRTDAAAAGGLVGGGLGALTADQNRRRLSGRNTDSVESPPVSVKVKMHNDGRHVTLRRLTEEEAEAQRRQDRRASAARRRRNSSFSSSSGGEALGGRLGTDSRWRRTEEIEAQQAAQNQAQMGAPPPPAPPMPMSVPQYPTPPLPGSQAIDPRTGQAYNIPPPPPIPGSASNLAPAGSITSPGTETSGATEYAEYANNRRRRRAERAQARLAREGRTQNTVDFT